MSSALQDPNRTTSLLCVVTHAAACCLATVHFALFGPHCARDAPMRGELTIFPVRKEGLSAADMDAIEQAVGSAAA